MCSVIQWYLPFCDPMDYSLPGSSVHGIFQARIQKWVAISYSRKSQPRNVKFESLASPALQIFFFFNHHAAWEAQNVIIAAAAAAAKSLQLCPTLCDPIDGSPPGSSIHGVFQARVLEWGAIAFSQCNH